MRMKILVVSIIAVLAATPVIAKDRISGGARANFAKGTLVIPCVKILNSDNLELEDHFFDVILEQRGKSLNYEVVFGELESDEACLPSIQAALENDDDTEDTDGSLEDILSVEPDDSVATKEVIEKEAVENKAIEKEVVENEVVENEVVKKEVVKKEVGDKESHDHKHHNGAVEGNVTPEADV